MIRQQREVYTMMRFLPFPSFLLLIFLLAGVCLPPSRAVAQPVPETVAVHVIRGFDQEYTLQIGALGEDGRMMVDMGGLSRALRLMHRRDAGHLVVEQREGERVASCHLYDRNNFVRLDPAEPSGSTRLVHLKAPPRLRGETLYLQAADAARLMTIWLDRQVSYDPAENRIEAFLWSARPGSEYRNIGVVSPDDRTIGAVPSGPAKLKGVDVEELANGVVVRFRASGGASVASFIKPDANGMAYLTFQQAGGNPADFSRTFTRGLLKEIKAIPLPGGALQISMAFNTELFNLRSTSYRWDERTNSYVVSALTDADVSEVYRREKEKKIHDELVRDQEKWKFDTIVLDAGHGGKDPGAVGPAGTLEKEVVLNIVRDLGALIQKSWTDVNVVYTRTGDTFIPLKERGKIANRHDGKLFVSVHCNAARNRSAQGAEVYILGPHKNEAALEVAMLENAAIKQEEDYQQKYKGFSEEHMILSSLAQNAFTQQSTQAARLVLEGMQQKTSLNDRGVRQAGFMVLWTPSMPSILVEAGYLSNRSEERLLRRRSTQQAIARGIFNGLSRYRIHYEAQQLAAAGEVQKK